LEHQLTAKHGAPQWLGSLSLSRRGTAAFLKTPVALAALMLTPLDLGQVALAVPRGWRMRYPE
jgi:hypothetical protein